MATTEPTLIPNRWLSVSRYVENPDTQSLEDPDEDPDTQSLEWRTQRGPTPNLWSGSRSVGVCASSRGVAKSVKFENVRAITSAVIHRELPTPKMGLEPTRELPDRILSPVRLPLPWHWKQVAVMLKVCESKARTSPPWCFRIVAAWG